MAPGARERAPAQRPPPTTKHPRARPRRARGVNARALAPEARLAEVREESAAHLYGERRCSRKRRYLGREVRTSHPRSAALGEAPDELAQVGHAQRADVVDGGDRDG